MVDTDQIKNILIQLEHFFNSVKEESNNEADVKSLEFP